MPSVLKLRGRPGNFKPNRKINYNKLRARYGIAKGKSGSAGALPELYGSGNLRLISVNHEWLALAVDHAIIDHHLADIGHGR
jgi:hypothetical protein